MRPPLAARDWPGAAVNTSTSTSGSASAEARFRNQERRFGAPTSVEPKIGCCIKAEI
jgi:hypothetical protein